MPAPTHSTSGGQSSASDNRGWSVAFSGLGINLALGILYTWSLFKGAIEKEFGWQGSQLNDPYALCCMGIAFAMILAGRCQDRFGPRITATTGGLLVSAGFILASTSSNYTVWMIGFGVLTGLGIGFGYSSATPPALKWFPPEKTGLIAGFVVSGFGIAPVYLAPVSQFLLGHYQVRSSMLIFGIAFAIIVCGLAQLLVNPPAGFIPASKGPRSGSAPAAHASPKDILSQPVFWLLWVLFCIGSGAGLMVIGSISGMANKCMGEQAFIAVAVMAIGNAGGRIVAGFLSDKIGCRWALFFVLFFQASLMFVAIPVTGSKDIAPILIVLVATFIGFCYGSLASIFPSFTKDLWGLKNFGLNYGILFTAWGVGGLVLPRLQQTLTAGSSGSYQSSFLTAGALLFLGSAMTFLIRTKPAPQT